MTLVIEDGSIVAGANSYASVTELVDYAAARGITNLPSTQGELEALLIRAMDYIEAKSERFAGFVLSSTQRLAWPRYGVYVNGYPLAYNAIPAVLKEAQLDIAANSVGIDLLPVQRPDAKGVVLEETVGPISVKYGQPPVGGSSLPVFPRAEALLAQLFARRGLSTYRV